MHILTKKISFQDNDQYILISALAAISYVAWVVYEPTLGWCATSVVAFGAIRIGLFFSWLIYIAKFRAKNKIFSWQNFACGATSGGLALALIIMVLGYINGIDNPLHPILQHFQPVVYMAPTATIAGLYASFASNKKAALLQGFYAFLFQFFIFGLATLPITCVY